MPICREIDCSQASIHSRANSYQPKSKNTKGEVSLPCMANFSWTGGQFFMRPARGSVGDFLCGKPRRENRRLTLKKMECRSSPHVKGQLRGGRAPAPNKGMLSAHGALSPSSVVLNLSACKIWESYIFHSLRALSLFTVWSTVTWHRSLRGRLYRVSWLDRDPGWRRGGGG